MNKLQKHRREVYYKNADWITKIIEFTYQKEIVFMDGVNNWKCVRGLRITNSNFFNYFLEQFKFFERNYNLYVSCAEYKFMPKFTLNLAVRSTQTSKFFNDLTINDITSYDLFLDFEGKNFNQMILDVYKVIQILSYYGVEYILIPSGSGFHLVVRGQNIDMKYTLENKTIVEHKIMIQKIKDVFDLETLDLKNAGIINRVRKLPFSLVNTHCCLPLNNKFLGTFKLMKQERYKSLFDIQVLKYSIDPKYYSGYLINNKGVKKNQENFKLFVEKCELL